MSDKTFWVYLSTSNGNCQPSPKNFGPVKIYVESVEQLLAMLALLIIPLICLPNVTVGTFGGRDWLSYLLCLPSSQSHHMIVQSVSHSENWITGETPSPNDSEIATPLQLNLKKYCELEANITKVGLWGKRLNIVLKVKFSFKSKILL